MKLRFLTVAGTLLFAVLVIFFLLIYPPRQRAIISPRQTLQIKNTWQLIDIWRQKGAKGRTALVFMRDLNWKTAQELTTASSYIDQALRLGIIRNACIVLSDSGFSTLHYSLAKKQQDSPLMTTKEGVAILYEAGRLDVIPLSKFVPPKEEPLLVLEPAAFTPQEWQNINRMLNSGQLSSDLLIILGL